jgi:hypothetical protein
MKNTCVVIAAFMTALVLFPAQLTFSQTAPQWKCAPCHDPLSKALPANHKAYTEKSCAMCHKEGGKGAPLGKIVHTAHLTKMPGTMSDCLACHTPAKGDEQAFAGGALAPFFSSWMKSPYLDSAHKDKGVYCTGCHKTYTDPFEARDTQEGCTKCHGDYDALLKASVKSSYEKNPHKSHYVDLRCNLCHKGHSKFTDYCAQCHQFGYKWEKKGAVSGKK